MTLEKTIELEDAFSPPRALFRKAVHFFSYHLFLSRKRETVTRVSGFELTVPPTVFHPKVFLTSSFFAEFLQSLDMNGMTVAEVGCGSGILSLSAAQAGAKSVLALDINPAAVHACNANAAHNQLPQVKSLHSNLFSAVPANQTFDVIVSSPPSFSGEPRDVADRAWHAGRGYRDILPLFDQAAQRLRRGGKMYVLLSSDTNRPLMESLIESAGFDSREVARRSIWVEAFYLLELSLAERASKETGN